MNCKTCSWWKSYNALSGPIGPIKWGECQNQHARMLTTSNDQGELSTHEDFGCVKWEKQ